MRIAIAFSLLSLPGLWACDSQSTTSQTVPVAPPVAPVTRGPASVKPAADSGSLRTFRWQGESCEYMGTYPAGAYTLQQLRGTYWVANGFGVLTTTTAFDLDQYNTAFFQRAAATLAHEHDSLTQLLRRLEVVPIPYWQRLKKLRELQLAEQYELGKAELAGYLQPASLLRTRYYPHCKSYADAIVSTDTALVLSALRKLIDQQKKDNGFPEQLEAEYQQAVTSPQGIHYAKMKLLTFGWSNCANDFSKYNNLEDHYRPILAFDKLFQQVKPYNCEDVD